MLADIELAQTLQTAPGEEKVEEVLHPLDRDYQLLRCQLQLMDSGGPEYKVSSAHLPLRYPGSPGSHPAFSPVCPDLRRVLEWEDHRVLVYKSPSSICSPQAIETYLEQTGNDYRCPTLQHVWKVNREGEVRRDTQTSPPWPLRG